VKKKFVSLIFLQEDYFNAIQATIEEQQKDPNGGEVKRPVLVFFRNQKELDLFYHSPNFARYKQEAILITEALTNTEKVQTVEKATVAGAVSLLTRSLGRGTDFQVSDELVKKAGGIAVITTFLSEELSEETQIKGRTARQGEKGSFHMVLLSIELEKFLINEDEIKDMRSTSSYWVFLNEKRNQWFSEQYKTNKTALGYLKNAHQHALSFSKALIENDVNFLKKYLEERNKGDELSSCRTLVLMDATGSMSHLLQKAKATVSQTFDRASKVLSNQGIKSGFQLQFAVYRNYNSPPDELLQCSTWESSPQGIDTFMKTIDVAGGWGNEAIEIGLWHANQELDQHPDDKFEVIIIGDAPANTEPEVTAKRAKGNWASTKFSRPCYWEKEMEALKSKKVRVNTFYVKNKQETVANFTAIRNAGHPGGRCEFLDVNSPIGAEMLTSFITTTILSNVGGDEKGKELVEKYEAMFPVTRV
jgi:hypothetical protein